MTSKIWEPLTLAHLSLKNRLVRAATFEGAGDRNGMPAAWLGEAYAELARNQVGLVLTGFAFPSVQGHAMQPTQCGIHDDATIPAWRAVTDQVHRAGGRIALQFTHAGRQTLSGVTGMPVVAPSAVKCTYFRQRPVELTEEQIMAIVEEYGEAARRARDAGFDAVQVHCAHGYLAHQFLSTHTNRRADQWGGSLPNRFRFARLALESIKQKCGDSFPVLVKLSVADDRGLTPEDSLATCRLFEQTGLVDAIELSYGTMEYAMNIFRGELPVRLVLKHNPLYKDYAPWLKWLWLRTGYPLLRRRFFPFSPNYNQAAAEPAARSLKVPLFLTGGLRSGEGIDSALDAGFAAVSLCRPFLREPDFGARLAADPKHRSLCVECNHCVVMCDSGAATRCYRIKRQASNP
jgi:2,4-dienoyl-CoA reductase-like NADH-dependent reductase (Old Yellow Enzyme family)